ncbi:P-loop containing nucleoside triphosphate hydrolase protein [Meira miltonrushii]|uniref:Mitochondrial Rho GTPase 1 n=1 Tax=Meira miltonrushii TaxID=1280837 RepID=A0A316VIZ5_9BASI|nr:P-loop containing nucleoside triphosphate hydrolase protein [Meira miltonrushii]PWN37582.1 P-loop containing nucleoside triphosphate hydrolase protein [Meira miltonrushii]
MRRDVRIVIAGDDDVGKSTLITSLIKEEFVSRVQQVVPEITLPPEVAPEGVVTKIVDTSSTPDRRLHLETELRRASVICLVYAISASSSFDRIPTYWLPFIRSLGVNRPVILVGNKIDLRSGEVTNAALEEELAPVMAEFKEVETCVECSAKIPLNVSEVFYFAQKAVLYPTAPLYDSRQHALKPACVDALRRIFRLCDSDKDGILSDAELNDFQRRCFDAPLQAQELEGIKDLVLSAPISGSRFPYDHLSASGSQSSTTGGLATPNGRHSPTKRSPSAHPHLRDGGLTLSGFLYLHTLFIQRGRLETTWTVLRTFGYGSDLTLEDSFVKPPFHVPADCSVELSPHGYQFLTDIFEAHDKDRDGALSSTEMANLFLTAPDGKNPWEETDFPDTTITDEHNAVTLQGWLAQWSMTTLLDYPTTLAYLAYLGYPSLIGSEGAIGLNGTTATPKSTAFRQSPPTNGKDRGSPTKKAPQPACTTGALKLTKKGQPKKQDKKKKGAQRNVFLAYVLGAAGCGKTALLRHMVGKGWEERYTPTGKVLSVVSAIEQSGAEKYLVLQEFGSRYEAEALRSSKKLHAADVLVFVYDSSDTNSFSYISNLRQQYPHLLHLPSLFLATKADLDLVQQRHEVQPEVYCSKLGLRIPPSSGRPIHVSVKLNELADVFGIICTVAQDPRSAMPEGARGEGRLMGLLRNRWFIYIGLTLIGGGTAVFIVGLRMPLATRQREFGHGWSGVGAAGWSQISSSLSRAGGFGVRQSSGQAGGATTSSLPNWLNWYRGSGDEL